MRSRAVIPQFAIPAKAGIQAGHCAWNGFSMDSRFRGNDGVS